MWHVSVGWSTAFTRRTVPTSLLNGLGGGGGGSLIPSESQGLLMGVL